MSKFDEYISGLEGRTDIDPLEVARDLLGLHNAEISTREAKINQQSGYIAERDETIKNRETDIANLKASNYDLTLMIPAAVNDTNVETPTGADDRGIDSATITLDDLFESPIRRGN